MHPKPYHLITSSVDYLSRACPENHHYFQQLIACISTSSCNCSRQWTHCCSSIWIQVALRRGPQPVHIIHYLCHCHFPWTSLWQVKPIFQCDNNAPSSQGIMGPLIITSASKITIQSTFSAFLLCLSQWVTPAGCACNLKLRIFVV